MIKPLLKHLVGTQRLNLFSTVTAWYTFKTTQLRIHPCVHTKFLDNCELHGRGKLNIGSRWENGRFRESEMVVAKNSKLILHGNMNVFTGLHIVVNSGAILELGSGYINAGLTLDCFEKIYIGENVAIAKNVTIRDSNNHEVTSINPTTDKTATSSGSKAIHIGDHVWIGTNVTILPGVTIGDNAVVAAGAVVSSDVAANTLAGGVPAKIIKKAIDWH